MIEVIQKPAALFIVCDPATDHNGAFSKSQINYFERAVKKTHRVFIEVVQGDGNPDRHLSIASAKAGQKIDLLFKFGHGNSHGQQLAVGKNHTVQDIEPETYRDHMTVNGCVYYIGCELTGFAQETAKIARIRTFGFQHCGEGDREIVIHAKGRYRIIECSNRQHSFYDEFDPDGNKEPDPFNSAEIFPRICELALLDDPQAQHILANHADTLEERLDWHCRAAEKGHAVSRKLIFLQKLKSLDPETIEKWFPEILEELIGTEAILYAERLERNGYPDLADRIYQKIFESEATCPADRLSIARRTAQIYQRKGDIPKALRAYAIAAGNNGDIAKTVLDKMYEEGLPVNGIRGKDLIALYRKLGILEQVLEWTKESAVSGDLVAKKWLSEIYEQREALVLWSLEGARILARFYEGFYFNPEDRDLTKAIEMYKLIASTGCEKAQFKLDKLTKTLT